METVKARVIVRETGVETIQKEMVKGERRGYPYGEISGVTQNQQYGCCWLITGLQEVRSDSEVVRL
eukprot:1334177-Amorphochlora_amoeboformis.AAC.1